MASIADKERRWCPFYGFAWVYNVMIDTNGNQCALAPGYPCKMEMDEKPPDWQECTIVSHEEKEWRMEEASRLVVIADELRPKGECAWEGVSFQDWYEYVMREHIV